MTSFIINAHTSRKLPPAWSAAAAADEHCAFCRIIRREVPAHRVYEDDLVIAILDILPLRPGHTLVIPKIHCSNVSDLEPPYSSALGETVSKVSRALVTALGNTGLNVVANQEYAQAVKHVHYHVIPAPTFAPPSDVNRPLLAEPLTQKAMHRAEFESRHELDDEEGQELMERIKARM